MRDVLGVDRSMDKRKVACRSLLRALAITAAVGSFVLQTAPALAQSNETVAQGVGRLTADGTLKADGTVSSRINRTASARLVADRVDDLALHPASRADVETLRELVSALKDELDAANIRIDRLQERLDAAAAAPLVPQVPPSEHVGAPLDPLADAFSRNSRVAAGLWGTNNVNMALALAGLDHSFVATGLDIGYLASLDPSDLAVDTGGAASVVFAHRLEPAFATDVAFAVLRPELQTSKPLPGHAGAITPAISQPSVAVTSAAQPASVGLMVAEAALAPAVVDARRPATLPVQHFLDANKNLAKLTHSNAEFDRALRAASRFSLLDANPSSIALDPIFSSYEQSALMQGGLAFRSSSVSRGLASVTLPLRLGNAKVSTKTSLQHFDQNSAYAEAPTAPLSSVSATGHTHYDAAAVDTSFVVPAFHKKVTINVRGGYDHLSRPDTTTLPYYPYDAENASYEVPTATAAGVTSNHAANPNNVDVQRYTYGASAAVPVAHNLNVGVGYSSQHLSGTYGVAAGEPPANRKDAYSGSLTYAPRGGKSSVTIVGREYRYSEESASSATVKETRGDVLFSVKF